MSLPLTYQEQYILLHGYKDLIPARWFPLKKGQTVESIYKKAIEKGVTWRKMTGWNGDKTGNDL